MFCCVIHQRNISLLLLLRNINYCEMFSDEQIVFAFMSTIQRCSLIRKHPCYSDLSYQMMFIHVISWLKCFVCRPQLRLLSQFFVGLVAVQPDKFVTYLCILCSLLGATCTYFNLIWPCSFSISNCHGDIRVLITGEQNESEFFQIIISANRIRVLCFLVPLYYLARSRKWPIS